MPIHHAAPEKSSRLRGILAMLIVRGAQGATTAELQRVNNNMAPGTSVSEIRACGYGIECLYENTSADGRKTYRYFLRSSPTPPLPQANEGQVENADSAAGCLAPAGKAAS